MSFLYADFTESTCNFGNYIIEYATNQRLKEFDIKIERRFDSFKSEVARDLAPENNESFILIPGCTMITDGQNPGLNKLSSLGLPLVCFAGSVWRKEASPGSLIRNRIVGKELVQEKTNVMDSLSGIIGCRDSFTYSLARSRGLKALYTGCPTLFLDNRGVKDDGYTLFSFGRLNLRKQVFYGKKLAKKGSVIGIVHEYAEYDRVKAAGWDLPLITYRDDIELYLTYFKNASVVCTGRLHGLLPGMAYEKPVMYFGDRDTRTSIIDDLGIRTYKYSDIPRAGDLVTKSFNSSLLEYFKENQNTMLKYIKSTFA